MTVVTSILIHRGKMIKKFTTLIAALLIVWNHAGFCVDEETTEPVAQGNNVFIDYQNYRHGYCPSCDCYPCRCNQCPPANPSSSAPCEVPPPACPSPCQAPACPPPQPPCEAPCEEEACAPACATAPCAPVCGTECGISACAIGIGIAALVTAAVLIVSSGNGHTSH